MNLKFLKDEKNRLIITIVALFLGLFTPFTKLTILGNYSFYKLASFESSFIIVFLLTALFLIFKSKDKFLFIPTVGIWIFIFLKPIGLYFDIQGMWGGDFVIKKGFKVFFDITNFQWGAYILIPSLLSFTSLSIIRYKKIT